MPVIFGIYPGFLLCRISVSRAWRRGSAFSPRSSSGVAVGTRVRVNPTFNKNSPFHRRLHYDSFSPDYLSQPIAMVDQGQHDADMPTAMAFYTWAATSRSIVRRSLAAPSSFFLVALTATLLPLRPVGPDGLPIMIGASARQEPGFRGHPPGSWRKPRVPSHCYDDAAQFREAVFSGASPERVR